MTDIVERLRREAICLDHYPGRQPYQMMAEAADDIEWLRAANSELEKRLKLEPPTLSFEEGERLEAEIERLENDILAHKALLDVRFKVKDLEAEIELWKSRVEQGAAIIEGNIAEIERLRTELDVTWAGRAQEVDRLQKAYQRKETELGQEIDAHNMTRAEIERLREALEDKC